MKNKSPLALIELLIMLLVFAAASALCLRAFYLSDRTSMENKVRDTAVMEVQNAAELVKHFAGDLAKCTEAYGGTHTNTEWVVDFDNDLQKSYSDAAYRLTVTLSAPIPNLGRATVMFSTTSGRVIFEISTAWQTEVNE